VCVLKLYYHIQILEGLKKIDYDPEKEGLKLENINKNRNLVVVPGEVFIFLDTEFI